MATIADLNVRLGMEIKDFERNRRLAKRKLKQTAREFQDLGNAMTMGVSVPILGFLGRSAQLWDKQADAIAQVEAGLKSTGNAAGFSSDELQKMASGIQEISTIGDEDILRNVTAQMLTFTKVTGEQFNKAQLAAANLSTKLKTDLKSATLQVGKALNDPVAGLTALTRSGIQFTDEQKNLIKSLVETNRVAEAQNVILGELETQFGGAAAAAADAGLGPMKQFQNTMGDIMELVGKQVVPIMNEAARRVKDLLERFTELNEGTQKNVVRFGLLAAAIGPGVLIMGKLITVGMRVQGMYKMLAGAIAIANTQMKLQSAQAAAGEISLSKMKIAVNGVRAAWGKLDLATKATTFGLVAAAIGLAVIAFQKLNAETDTMTKLTNDAEKSIVSERLEAERLTKVIQNENATREEKAKALNKLKAINPVYFGQLDTEKSSIEDINKALGNYTNNLLRLAKAKAIEQKTIELEKQKIDLAEKLRKKQEQVSKAGGIMGALLNTAGGSGKSGIQLLKDQIKEIEQAQKALSNSMKGGLVSNLFASASSNLSSHFKGSSGGGEEPVKPQTPEPTILQPLVDGARLLNEELTALPQKWTEVTSVMAEQVPQVTTLFDQQKTKLGELIDKYFDLAQIGEDVTKSAIQSMEDMANAGETSYKKLGKAALKAGADEVRSAIMTGVANVIKSVLTTVPFPLNIGIAGAAGAAAGVLFNKALSAAKIPAFADGGIVTAPTLAMVGDNPSRKEAIIPLEKMGQVFGRMGGSNVEVKILATPQGLAAIVERGNKDRGRRSGF